MSRKSELRDAVGEWLKDYCSVGFGDVYCRELLLSFEQWLHNNAILQTSPGMPAFSKEMNCRGFGRKRVSGLQHITGLKLVVPVVGDVKEMRLARAMTRAKKSERIRQKREASVKASINAIVSEVQDMDKVRLRMREETKERNINVENNDQSL